MSDRPVFESSLFIYVASVINIVTSGLIGGFRDETVSDESLIHRLTSKVMKFIDLS
jgi:hypothetical protein